MLLSAPFRRRALASAFAMFSAVSLASAQSIDTAEALATAARSLPSAKAAAAEGKVARAIEQAVGSVELKKVSPAEAEQIRTKIDRLRQQPLAHSCGHATALSCSVTTAGELTTSDCVESTDNTLYDIYTFNGIAGQAVQIDMTSATMDTFLILLDPSLNLADSDDDDGLDDDSRINFTLTSSGTWTVIANTFSRETGSYSIMVSGAGCGGTAPPPCTPTPQTMSCNTTASGNLASTDCQLSDGARYDVYTFSGTAGQQVTITMTSTAIDSWLGLFDPSGGLAVEDDDSAGGNNSRITYTLTTTGTWIITATSFGANETGAYSLQLQCGTTGPTTCTTGGPNLCLQNRFLINVTWRDFSNNTGVGTAIPFSNDTGMFWFFSSSNVELVLKVLDGHPVNNRWWVFYGALSNVEYTITVRDTQTGAVKTYNNASGNLASVADTNAFP